MGCSTCGGKSRPSADDQDVYVLTYPDGSTAEVSGLHAAKVASTIRPGTVYRRK